MFSAWSGGDTVRLCARVDPRESGGRPPLTLLYAARGSAEVLLPDGARLPLMADRLVLLAGGAGAEILPANGAHVRALGIEPARCEVPGLSLRELKQASSAFAQLCALKADAVSFDDPHALVTGAALCLAACAALPESATACEGLLLCYALLAAAEAIQAEEHGVHAGNRHVRRALKYMHAGYMRDISAADIAAHVGIHIGHLHRLFHAETGRRINAYLTSLRMEKAKRLLMGTDLSITDIAQAVGMATQQYFNRVFKQYAGVTPQAYRGVFNITCDYAQADRQYYVAVTTEEYMRGLVMQEVDR